MRTTIGTAALIAFLEVFSGCAGAQKLTLADEIQGHYVVASSKGTSCSNQDSFMPANTLLLTESYANGKPRQARDCLGQEDSMIIDYYQNGIIKQISKIVPGKCTVTKKGNNFGGNIMQDTAPYLKTVEKYDTDGNLISKEIWNWNGKTAERVWDSEGKVIKDCAWNPSQVLEECKFRRFKGIKMNGTCNIYDSKGNLTKKEVTLGINTTTYHYNKTIPSSGKK